MAARSGSTRTLTGRELNRAVLARQLLLERAQVPFPRALERMAGLQAQYAPSMYIGLWSRVDGFRREELTQALERRTVVQGTLMRATIHLVSAGDYWPFALATRDPRRKWWLRAARDHSADELADAAQRLRERLAAGPLRRAELDEIIGRQLATAVSLWVDLVRVPPSGTWERRRADLYGAADDWVPLPDDLTLDLAMEHLVRRYLGGFGPATVAEIADWGGMLVGEVTPVLERLQLRRFQGERGQELVDLPRAPLPDPGTPAPVRFLPTWDATLLVHARRTQILPEEHRSKVFSAMTPQSVGTFLVDGAVAGTWRHEGGRVRVDAFRPLDRTTSRQVDDEAGRLALLHA